jgi:hypothetical protein
MAVAKADHARQLVRGATLVPVVLFQAAIYHSLAGCLPQPCWLSTTALG